MSDSIAILGAGGFIGHHLVTALANAGEKVIALMRHGEEFDIPGVESYFAPFKEPEEFNIPLERAKIVIHAASCTTPGLTEGDPLKELDLNLRPTLALLHALQGAPHCRLIYISSGGTLYGEAAAGAALETQSILPKSYYGAGKAASEHFIHAASAQFGLSAIILRPSNLYGPGQRVKRGFGIIPTAFECARNEEPLTVWGDGSAVRDYLYIEDFIDLCMAVLSLPAQGRVSIFNASSGNGVDLKTLLSIIGEVINTPVPVRFEANRKVDVSRIVLNPEKALDMFNWRAKTPLAVGIQKSWQWWSEEA